MSNTEYQPVIKLFARKGLNATEITKELADVYGDSASSHRTVAKWIAGFKDTPRGFEDTSQSDRASIALTDENIPAVEEVVMRDRQLPV